MVIEKRLLYVVFLGCNEFMVHAMKKDFLFLEIFLEAL